MAMCPAARDFGPLASNFDPGILADFKEKLRRPGAKDPPVGHVDMFQTSPKLCAKKETLRRGFRFSIFFAIRLPPPPVPAAVEAV